MVTETTLVAVAVEGAEGFDSSVLFVLFQQEWGIVDGGGINTVEHGGADEDVVDALPEALIAVGGLGTVGTL